MPPETGFTKEADMLNKLILWGEIPPALNQKYSIVQILDDADGLRLKLIGNDNLEYVLDSLKCTTSKIRNIKKYLLACLFNAPTTISSYYQQAVNHDFPQYAKVR